MTASVLSFVGKNPNNFNGNWGGQAASDFDPQRNRIELLRFVGLLLSDLSVRTASSDEIIDRIASDLNVTLMDSDRADLLSCLEVHPSFKRVSDDLFELI